MFFHPKLLRLLQSSPIPNATSWNGWLPSKSRVKLTIYLVTYEWKISPTHIFIINMFWWYYNMLETKLSMIDGWLWWELQYIMMVFCNLFQTLLICLSMCMNVLSCDLLSLCFLLYLLLFFFSFIFFLYLFSFFLDWGEGVEISLHNLPSEKSILT